MVWLVSKLRSKLSKGRSEQRNNNNKTNKNNICSTSVAGYRYAYEVLSDETEPVAMHQASASDDSVYLSVCDDECEEKETETQEASAVHVAEIAVKELSLSAGDASTSAPPLCSSVSVNSSVSVYSSVFHRYRYHSSVSHLLFPPFSDREADAPITDDVNVLEASDGPERLPLSLRGFGHGGGGRPFFGVRRRVHLRGAISPTIDMVNGDTVEVSLVCWLPDRTVTLRLLLFGRHGTKVRQRMLVCFAEKDSALCLTCSLVPFRFPWCSIPRDKRYVRFHSLHIRSVTLLFLQVHWREQLSG